MIKTFAQLKRDLHEGVIVKTITNNIKPSKEGQIRKVSIVQSNAIAFEDETTRSGVSWLWWRKAKDYTYEDNIVKCYYNGELDFVYEIVG